MDQRYSDNEPSRRDIPSFLEPRTPLIQNPFMRPRPQKGINLLEQFEDASDIEEPDLVQVYLRMKPCNVPSNLYEVKSNKCLVTSLDTTTAGHGRRTQHNVSRMYTFSRIFKPECSQKEIFDEVVKENLKKLPDGHSFTLLAYGASGSGKTYTLMGTVNSPGLIPRSLEYVFKLVDAAQMPSFKPSDSGADELSYAKQDYELQWVQRLRHVSAPLRDKYRRMSAQLQNELTISTFDLTNRTKYYVWVSFVEIYNEAIYDLLAPPDKREKMRIREDTSGNVYVKGVTQAFVRSGEEAYDVMVAGKQNLIVAATGIHAHSSRSHCIFTITMLTENDGEIKTSHVRLCDLAGSERQRAARNTGARMQESRAINSSLHVLERCLHMLRRKQRLAIDKGMVPYRESKLTRLLGSGLSGSRGEAVSMVVTLNPAPQYAHETKHVLSLAAVAQDIQINNTMFASTLSTLESSTQESTICTSAEVMKLRCDNERLHFELAQSRARNKELLASMKEKQQQTADTMREISEETKDMMRQYYEPQIQSLQAEIDEMREEYESRLSNQPAPAPSGGTPSRYLQTKVAQLMTEITVLEDKLSEEKLARARAEKEVQHLRSCIEERDEKAFKETTSSDNQEEIVIADSDSDDDSSDPLNESLEPVFKKDCLNRSRIVHDQVSKHVGTPEVDETVEENTVNEEDHDSNGDKSNDSLNHDDSDVSVTSKDSLYATGDEENEFEEESEQVESSRNSEAKTVTFDSNNVKEENSTIDVRDISVMNDNIADKDRSECEELFQISIKLNDETHDEIKKHVTATNLVETYLENDEPQKENVNNDLKFKHVNTERGTSSVEQSALSFYSKVDIGDASTKDKEYKINEINPTKEYKINEINPTKDLEFLKHDVVQSNLRGTYFVKDDVPQKEYLNDNLTFKHVNTRRGTFNIAEPVLDSHNDVNTEDANTKDKEFKTNQIIKEKKASEILLNKIVKSFTTNQSSDSSLTQFEQLEMAANNVDNSKDKSIDFGDIKLLKEKRTYFDDTAKEVTKNLNIIKPIDIEHIHTVEKINNKNVPDALVDTKKQEKSKYFESETKKHKISHLSSAAKTQEKQLYFDDNDQTNSNDVLISMCGGKNQPFFDNIHASVDSASNKKVNDIIIHSLKDNERSPSIVKDDTCKDYQPSSTMKKLVREGCKKHESVDIFESPQMNIAKVKEIIDHIETVTSKIAEKSEDNVKHVEIAPVTKETEPSSIDVVRKSIARLVLEQKIKANIKQEIKSEPASFEESVTENVQKCISRKGQVKDNIVDKITVTSEKALNDTQSTKENNTIDEFENICKDLSNARATEFELLLSQEISTANETTDNENEPGSVCSTNVKEKSEKEISDQTKNIEEAKYNLRHKEKMSEQTKKFEEVKYNLRDKAKFINRNVFDDNKEIEVEQISAESHRHEIKTRTATKRNLRSRRRQNRDDESSDQDNETKLKDIINLKKEFSDVTMGVPAIKREIKDIPSPEKIHGEENLPPIMGIQSCPSKSVTRSRRKLFTPRAEPLEESPGQTGDSNERLCVPRPSYHRTRVRRKL